MPAPGPQARKGRAQKEGQGRGHAQSPISGGVGANVVPSGNARCRLSESNGRPSAYKAGALPTELAGRVAVCGRQGPAEYRWGYPPSAGADALLMIPQRPDARSRRLRFKHPIAAGRAMSPARNGSCQRTFRRSKGRAVAQPVSEAFMPTSRTATLTTLRSRRTCAKVLRRLRSRDKATKSADQTA